MKALIILLFCSLSAFAQTHEELPVVTDIQKAAAEVKQEVSGSSFYRDNSTGSALLGFELLSTWVPFKFTGSYTHILNKSWSLEAEFARGKFGVGALGFDAASVTEFRYSIIARKYMGNSFNWIFGLYKDDFTAKLGSDFIDDMTNTSIDDFRVQVYGASLGFGNRWQWQKGFTLGIDWIRLNLPVFGNKIDDGVLKYIDDSGDNDVVKDVIDRVAHVPTFTILGIYLGYTF